MGRERLKTLSPDRAPIWEAEESFSCYGARFGVRVNERRLLAVVARHLPPRSEVVASPVVDRLYSFATMTPEPDHPGEEIRFFRDDHMVESPRLSEVLEYFESDTQMFVAEMARPYVFVHAGVVAWRGRAIVIPGRSFTGKSTLVYELVRAGAAYYSDEYAVLDASGRVHPFPRPLALRASGARAAEKRSVESLEGKVGLAPVPVGLVVATEYHQGAAWQPQRLSEGLGVLEMLANTVPARTNPEQALSTLEATLQSASVLKGPRGEAADEASRILAAHEELSLADGVEGSVAEVRPLLAGVGGHLHPRFHGASETGGIEEMGAG
jgi:hypothetical protein